MTDETSLTRGWRGMPRLAVRGSDASSVSFTRRMVRTAESPPAGTRDSYEVCLGLSKAMASAGTEAMPNNVPLSLRYGT